ncbi:MAG: hypothetical protein WCU88_09795 [Elusimicrobiota bacterium]|jgi:hypothetical protein
MEKSTVGPDEESGLGALEETDGGVSSRQDGRGSKLSRYIKIQLYLPLKDVVMLDEQRLKLMRQGHDLSRSRLVADAIQHYAKSGVEPKIEGKA